MACSMLRLLLRGMPSEMVSAVVGMVDVVGVGEGAAYHGPYSVITSHTAPGAAEPAARRGGHYHHGSAAARVSFGRFAEVVRIALMSVHSLHLYRLPACRLYPICRPPRSLARSRAWGGMVISDRQRGPGGRWMGRWCTCIVRYEDFVEHAESVFRAVSAVCSAVCTPLPRCSASVPARPPACLPHLDHHRDDHSQPASQPASQGLWRCRRCCCAQKQSLCLGGECGGHRVITY
jgi:hypothetical protein